MSNLGSVIQATATAWLMTTLTTSPVLIASVQTAANAPTVLFALVAGTSADLFNKRMQMLFANALCFLAIVLLIYLMLQNAITPIWLLTLTAIISIGSVAFMPAWHSSVTEIVPRHMLPAAISLNNLAFNVARAAGPAIGAEIIALAGVAVAFGTNAFSFGVMIVALLSWRHRPAPKPLLPETIGNAVIDGLRFVTLSPGLRLHMLRGFLLTLFGSAVLALQPVVAVNLGAGTRGFGILLSGFGFGAIVGSLTVVWFRTRVSPDRQLSMAMALFGTASMLLALSTSLLQASASLFLCGIAWTQSAATLQVTVQTSCPRWVTARTISVFSTLFALGIAIGAIFWGSVALVLNLSVALILSSVGMIATAAMSTLIRIHDPEDAELQPRFDMKRTPMPSISPRSGPAWITVEYQVPPNNIEDFLSLMREYAFIRKRCGARNWILVQDIDNPEILNEQFQCPTWNDYLHSVSRVVVGDSDIQSRVGKLCNGLPTGRRVLERPTRAKELPSAPVEARKQQPLKSSVRGSEAK